MSPVKRASTVTGLRKGIGQAATPVPESADGFLPPVPKAKPAQPVRITLNLPPELARQLMRWTGQAAESIDAPRVHVQDALRAMVRVITDESAPNASMKVLALLREDRA